MIRSMLPACMPFSPNFYAQQLMRSFHRQPQARSGASRRHVGAHASSWRSITLRPRRSMSTGCGVRLARTRSLIAAMPIAPTGMPLRSQRLIAMPRTPFTTCPSDCARARSVRRRRVAIRRSAPPAKRRCGTLRPQRATQGMAIPPTRMPSGLRVPISTVIARIGGRMLCAHSCCRAHAL
jgi:hypothetical protein